jgi:hypothetical protein
LRNPCVSKYYIGLGFLKYGNIWEQHSTIKTACKDLIVF